MARRLSEKGYTIKDSRRIMGDVVDLIMEVLAENEEINLRGFGKFVIRHRNVYGDLPKWASEDDIDENGNLIGHPVIRFIPSRALRVSIATHQPVTHDTRIGTYRSKYNPLSRKKKDSVEEEFDDG